MTPINHYEGDRPNVITQHNFQWANCIDFHGWVKMPVFGVTYTVAIFRIKYKQ